MDDKQIERCTKFIKSKLASFGKILKHAKQSKSQGVLIENLERKLAAAAKKKDEAAFEKLSKQLKAALLENQKQRKACMADVKAVIGDVNKVRKLLK